MAAEPEELSIGALSAAASINVETVRFYQRKGLIPEPPRTRGTIRRYGRDTLARVRFIKAAQRLGFTLAQVAELLDLDDGEDCEASRRVAERKLEEVRERLADLRRIEMALAELVADCRSKRGAVKCPLIASLQDG